MSSGGSTVELREKFVAEGIDQEVPQFAQPPVFGQQGPARRTGDGRSPSDSGKKALRGSKAVVSSVMATYCMLPQKAKALTKPDHRKLEPLEAISRP